jgi:O-antigen ligase
MIYEKTNSNNKISNMIVVFLLLGTALRIPVSSNMTISLGEIVLLISLLGTILLFFMKRIYFTNKDSKLFLILYVIASFFIMFALVNYENILSILLLFEYLFIGIFLLFIFNKLHFNQKVYFKTLILFSLYLSLNSIIYNVISYEVGNVTRILQFGSINYTTAIMLLIIPIIYIYIREGVSTNFNWLAYLSIILMMVSIFFSGSRSNIIVLLFQVSLFTFFAKNSFSNRIKAVSSILITSLIAYSIISLINPQLNYVIQRYFTFFYNDGVGRNDILHSDIVRNRLKDQAAVIISENKFWGTGFARLPNSDIPIHNFVYEILLGLGFFGLLFFLIYFLSFVIITLKKIPKQNSIRLISIIMIISFLAISWVHPFMTTGKEFTMIFWLNMVGLSLFKSMNKKDEFT